MKSKKTLIAILVLSLLLSQWSYVFADSETAGEDPQVLTSTEGVSTGTEETPTDYIVSYYPDKELAPAVEKDLLTKAESQEEIAPEMDLIQFPEGENIDASLKKIENDPAVQFVEPDQQRFLMDDPNDPRYSDQWALSSIKAPTAWTVAGTLQKSVVVAVIDSGVMSTHEDLVGRIAPGAVNFVDSSGTGDGKGHGTNVAGIIAAETGNAKGIAGVTGTLDVSILPIKVFDAAGNGCTSSMLVQAITYAIAQNVDVINMSLGGVEYSAAEAQAVRNAIAAGIVVVAAAGNDGITAYSYPASYPGVISVGAVTSSGAIAYFSNHNDKVTVTAPGTNILSTAHDGSYEYASGTSFSAPIVSAIAAVIKGEHPGYTPAQIKEIIETTAVDAGSTGKDNYYGYGEVDFSNALSGSNSWTGASGIIDDLVFDRNGAMIVTSLGGITGYAYALAVHNSETNALYEYLKGTNDAPTLYGFRSGTRYMVFGGTGGYDENYSLFSTPRKAMDATPATVTDDYYVLKGFSTTGGAILVPLSSE